ncbi:MAG: leucine-rich repeat protein [Lachnospiraceae bacterium]|nr:leucine-rich repeat protein [Lachnospiraceae bacterium]
MRKVKNLSLLCDGNVKKIKVEKGNKYFSDYDNALYNKRKTKLYACPEGKTNILLPAALTSIGSGSDDVDELDEMFGKVKEIQVKTGNKKYSSYKGLLYNKKVTKVLFCTKNKKTVVLPKTVKRIEKYAFYGCNKLKNITFPEKLDELAQFSFKNCSSLEYVKFPDDAGKTSDDFKKRICIYPLAFMNCSSLKWVYAPENMYFWGEANKWIFIGCNNLKDIYYSGSENEWLDCVNQSVLDDLWELYSDYKNSMTVEPLITIHFEAKAPL